MASKELYDEDDELLGLLDKKPTTTKLTDEGSSSSPMLPTSSANPTIDPTSSSVPSSPVQLVEPFKPHAQLKDQDFVIPILMGNDYPESYQEVVDRMLFQYKYLPELDYDAIYTELKVLSIKSCPTPTLQVINLEFEKVQAAKDRLSEIFIGLLRCHSFKKRAVDILRDSWSRFSKESSADKRKGDAAYRLSDFERDFAQTDACLKSCLHILRNLDSLSDTLSRRVTVIQLQLKLHDIGRGALPDFDFEKETYAALGEKPSELDNEDKETIIDGKRQAKELSFES